MIIWLHFVNIFKNIVSVWIHPYVRCEHVDSEHIQTDQININIISNKDKEDKSDYYLNNSSILLSTKINPSCVLVLNKRLHSLSKKAMSSTPKDVSST